MTKIRNMKKILITGFLGFVSNHFLEFLSTLDEAFEIILVLAEAV